MQKHGWKTPFEMALGGVPNLSHLRKIGCKAYALDKHIPLKQKLKERAHIGHLMGYDSTNIFCIWIPSQRKIIRTRDVQFDENFFYNSAKLEPDLSQLTLEPMTYAVPPMNPAAQITEIESDEDEWEPNVLADLGPGHGEENENDDDFHDDKFYDASTRTDEIQPNQIQLPSPDASENDSLNQPFPSQSLPSDTSVRALISAQRAREVSADLDEANILPEGVTRRRKKIDRREAYATALDNTANRELNAFHTAFASGFSASFFDNGLYRDDSPSPSTSKSEQRFHRDDLPPEPKTYHQMLKHPHSQGFMKAVEVEITALQNKNTWTEVSLDHASKAGKTPIPTTWVFKYKFDEQGYLTKYKARLCTRGDLQHTEQDKFAATIAACIFRSLMALVAVFDLETRQYDAVNAFANSPIDETTYCKIPDGWTGSKAILLLSSQGHLWSKAVSGLVV